MININGKEVAPSIASLQPTDFSKVTARPEFVLKGKKFHDEAGQLREGTLTPPSIKLQEKEVTPSAADQDVEADDGFYGLSRVAVHGDTNLKAENIAEGVAIFGVTGTHSGGSTGGGDIDALIDRSITEVSSGATKIGYDALRNCTKLTSANFPNATVVDNWAFYCCEELENVIIPNATSIGNSSFYVCKKLKSADFPNAVSIDNDAFYSCSALRSVNFPKATSIGSSALRGCSALARVNFPEATSIGSYAFGSCHALTSADFPKVSSVASNMFDTCPKLESVNFPNATSIGESAFTGCSQLENANIPNATNISARVFYKCNALKRADLPNATSIGSSAFYYCYLLRAVILRSETMCTLSSTNAFNVCYHILGTAHTTYNPNGDKDGYFYVPRALLSDDDETMDYRRATNWSTYASQFRALEDYTVDGTITGELDPTKI